MTEDELRDLTMRTLFDRFGTPNSWRGQGKKSTFELGLPGMVGEVAAERKLDYGLPGGRRLSPCSDILATIRPDLDTVGTERFVSIEIKHASAVTDQFKCRSFDMLHLKQQFGDRVFGIMFFARAGNGIGFDHARAISYPFDVFVGVDLLKTEPGLWWVELVAAMERGFGFAA